MFKTNSRKGLGLASIIALAASAFVGVTPAQASDVTISPNAGTNYNAISGETFTVSAVVGLGTTDADWQLLKYEIKNTANATFSATVSPAAIGATAATTSITASSVVLGGATVSRTAKLQLQTATTTSDVVFTVQAWVDIDNDGVIDSNEVKSAVETISFFKLSGITFTTALTPVVLGATKFTAVVSTDKSINLAQANKSLQIGFGSVATDGTITATGSPLSSASATAFTAGPAVTLDTAKLTGKAEPAASIVAATTYVAQAVYGGAEVGAAVTSVVGAAPVSALSAATISNGVNVKGAKIRTGTTAVTVTSVASKSNTVLAAAGTVIAVEVAEASANSIDASASMVAGGKTLTNSVSGTVQKITFDVTVGADGKIAVPLALSGLKDGNQFNVKLTNGSVTVNQTWAIEDTAATEVKDLTLLGDGAVLRVVTGSTFGLTFGVVDNFDQPLTEAGYRLTLTNNASTATVSQTLVDGKTTFSVTDSSTKTETPYTASLEVLSAASNTYVAVAGMSKSIAVTPVTSIAAPSAITAVVSTTSAFALNVDEHFAADTRVGQTAPEVDQQGLNNAGTATISGQVTAANGLGTYASVTLAAPGVLFEAGGVWSLGSITVHTSATGAYGNVKAYSQKAGKISISATAGAATKDVGVTFAEALESSATNIEITAPANAVPGSTLQIKAKLTDKFGNAVKVSSSGLLSVKYVGPGFVTATLPSTTDKDGELMFSVLLGAADSGTSTVTIAYDGDGVATTTKDNVAKAASVTIGAAASTPSSDQKLTVGSFKGFVAIYALNYTGQKLSAKVAGKWLVENNLSRFQRVVRNTGAAIPIVVELYIDGKLVRTENIVTK